MVAPAPAPNTLSTLLAQCRDEPLVYDGVRPELCEALAQVILARMERDRGRSTGSLNVGGWKSGEDFLTWNDGAVQELRATFCEITGVPTTRSYVSWAMVNRAGSHHPRHQHRLASISGVYYVHAGSPDCITPTIFECPCDGRKVRPSDKHEMQIDPHPGRLVICRGETWHRVPKYLGAEPRITIAFDVRR